MPLSNYRTLGKSGLVVSPLSLGTMTFGQSAWGAADESSARAIFDAYLDAGGNFIDTADVYSSGRCEQMLGSFIRDRSARDGLVLATKFGFYGGAGAKSPEQGGLRRPNLGGAGAKNMHRVLEGSLKRLGTDFIDVFWMHIWDGVTPVKEIVQTLSHMVASGKIRYYAFSDMPAWFVAKAAAIAAERGLPGPIAMQVEYSLVARDVEAEHLPAAWDSDVGVVPWSPLAGGLLSGKYTREMLADAGRLSGPNPFGASKFSERNWHIVDVVNKVAQALQATPSQVAIAWLLSKRGVASVTLGARTVEQLKSNIPSAQLKLPDGHVEQLDEVSRPTPGFSASLASPAIRKMLFGGYGVRGWGEA